jgi:glutamate--cysteine ligase
MFFVVRGDEYRAAKGVTFREFMAKGFGEARATMKDWDIHLTTLFPEVRLKRIIEVRGADAVPRALVCALPAIWKGLLYDRDSLAAATGLVGDTSAEDRDSANLSVAQKGLSASCFGRPVLELAEEVTQIASEGLRRIAERGETDADERNFLDPVLEQLDAGQSPGEQILERWRGEWGYSRERLIAATRY